MMLANASWNHHFLFLMPLLKLWCFCMLVMLFAITYFYFFPPIYSFIQSFRFLFYGGKSPVFFLQKYSRKFNQNFSYVSPADKLTDESFIPSTVLSKWLFSDKNENKVFYSLHQIFFKNCHQFIYQIEIVRFCLASNSYSIRINRREYTGRRREIILYSQHIRYSCSQYRRKKTTNAEIL